MWTGCRKPADAGQHFAFTATTVRRAAAHGAHTTNLRLRAHTFLRTGFNVTVGTAGLFSRAGCALLAPVALNHCSYLFSLDVSCISSSLPTYLFVLCGLAWLVCGGVPGVLGFWVLGNILPLGSFHSATYSATWIPPPVCVLLTFSNADIPH